jgi:tRNA 2-thiocytidine biosynthesis protein TtcA
MNPGSSSQVDAHGARAIAGRAADPDAALRALVRDVGRAIADFDLIADGDRIMVAVSGGKDSYTLLTLLGLMQRRAPVRFDLVAVHLDQGHPGYDGAPLRRYLEQSGVEHHILAEDTYSIVTDKIPEGKTYCSLCSRLRRGILYKAADALRCNKIALGHHRDDALETLLLNLFFAGKLAAMPARLVSDDGAHVVIRPLIYCAEETIVRHAEAQAYPILPCNLCGSQSEAQRKQMKALLDRMEAEHPHLRSTMLAALGNVVPSHLLDGKLTGVKTTAPAAAPEELVAASRLRVGSSR